ncbi:MAG: hypothetical protein ACTSO9_09940 [Candidatus Helarchaeota archaeon]
MLKINWKYLIILAVLAGIIYFIVSIFTLGTVEAIEGNIAGYILLIITWIGVIVFCKMFQNRLKIKDLMRLVFFGMITHVYFCFFYFLLEISNLYALTSLPILLISLYAVYNKEDFLNKLRIFGFYTNLRTPGHPYIFDKEYKAYVFKNWNGYEALKYLEIKSGRDPIELLTIFHKAQIEITLELHYFNNNLRIFCGIITSGKSYENTMVQNKKKFFELYNYLRFFGYDPVEIWDSYTMEQILEAPYMTWTPEYPSNIQKNQNLEDEHVIVKSGMKICKYSLFQLGNKFNILNRKQGSKIIIKRNSESIETHIDSNNEIIGMVKFLKKISNNNGKLDDFLFVLRLHPFNENELNKEKNVIRNKLTRVINHFKTDLQNNEANLKMVHLSQAFGGNDSSNRKSGIFNLLYPDEAKDFEKFWDEFENFQLGEEIGYWKMCSYFVGKKYLANILATELNASLIPLHIANFHYIIRRKVFGIANNMDSRGLINYIPFQNAE